MVAKSIVYQIEWANGNTDVFDDREEAVRYYANAEPDIADGARAGDYVRVGDATPPGPCCRWTDLADAKRRAAEEAQPATPQG